MKRFRNRSVIPGFGLSFGLTISILSLIVVIPLCSLVLFSAQLTVKEFWDAVTAPRILASYAVSLKTAFIAAAINAVMGLILAWTIVRYDFPGKRLIDGAIELPFALPTAVAGISLTYMTTNKGFIGSFFHRYFDLDIAYTPLGIVVALIFIGIPFVVRTVQPVLEKIDIQYEEAAFLLGANRWKIFTTVILPELIPALLSGFSLAFARGLGEYGSVVFISGNIPYKTEIAPLMIMAQLQEYDYASATSIALVMLFFAFVILSVNAYVQARTARRVNANA